MEEAKHEDELKAKKLEQESLVEATQNLQIK